MRRRLFPNFIGDVVELNERQERMQKNMQILSITPEHPYTININDGTRNRVMLGKINGDYGIKTVNNAGATIIFADGHITADGITTGTLDADIVNVINIDAENITVNYLSATKIQGGILNCSTMTVQNLEAGSIIGQFVNINGMLIAQSIHGEKIMAETLSADRISAHTITADRIVAHEISTEQISHQNVDGEYILMDQSIRNRAVYSDLSASKLTAGTLSVGGTGKVNLINLDQSGGYGDAFLRWSGGSRIWSDGSNRIGMNSIGSPMYIYVNSWDKIIIPEDGQVTIKGGVYITATSGSGHLNVDGNFRLGGHISGSLNMNGEQLLNCSEAWITVMNSATINNNTFLGNNIWYWNLYNYSDKTLKKNIKTKHSCLSDILKLQPIEFEYKKDKEKKKHVGFLAEDVEKVLPDLVGKDNKGTKGVDTTEMIPILVGAVKELREEISLLKEVVGRGN